MGRLVRAHRVLMHLPAGRHACSLSILHHMFHVFACTVTRAVLIL